MMVVLIHLDRQKMVLHLDDMVNRRDVQHLELLHLQDVVHLFLVELQILDELHLVVNLSFQDVVLLVLVAHLDAMVAVLVDEALVGVESRQLRMDYCLHAVGVEDYLQPDQVLELLV